MDVVLYEIPFVFIIDGKECAERELNTPLTSGCESYLFDMFGRRIDEYRRSVYMPTYIHTTYELTKFPLRDPNKFANLHVPSYYTTTDVRWFLSFEKSGFVKYLDKKPHKGIQNIEKTVRFEKYRSVPAYIIRILYGDILHEVPVYEKDILSFKKFQQAYIHYAGVLIPSIKNKLWEEIVGFYLNRVFTAPLPVAEPKKIITSNPTKLTRFVELAVDKGFHLDAATAVYVVEKLTEDEFRAFLNNASPDKLVLSIEDFINIPAYSEIKKLRGTVDNLIDRLGVDTNKTLSKRYKDDKKIMDGVLK